VERRTESTEGRVAVLDLTTSYLGLRLRSPLVASASPLARSLEQVRRLEGAGVGAIVMHSLFEEEIIAESHELDRFLDRGGLIHAEASNYLPALESYRRTPEQYIDHLKRVRKAVRVPVIGSLNGVSPGGWVTYAREIEEAGADALELNTYYIPSDPDLTGAELEENYITLVRDVRAAVSLPIAVKLSPFFTSLPNVAQRLAEAGADGLVLFNRFYQPDIDVELMEVVPSVSLSTSQDLRLPLRWVAILYRRVAVDFALSGGVHCAEDAVKALMAGASVAMTTSSLLRHGASHVAQILRELERWILEHGYHSASEMIGSMSQCAVSEPAAYERANYIRALHSYDHRVGL
jgi:dihydroorotate dehydrogenase (fumarate)